MSKNLYNSITFKKNRNNLNVDLFDLKDLANKPHLIASKEQIFKAISREIKMILESDDLSTMIAGIFELEESIVRIAHEDEFEDFHSLELFFRDLSPLMLRKIQECLEVPALRDKIFEELKVAIELALEEEFGFCQAHISSLSI